MAIKVNNTTVIDDSRNITTSVGTVDGRNVATDGSKLDGIASGANNYSHPTGNGNNHIPSGGSSGQILQYSSAGTAAWAAAPAGGIQGMNWGYYRSPTGNTANGTHTITMNPYSYVEFTGYTYNRVDIQVAGTNVLPRFQGAGYGGGGGFSLIYNNNTASSVTLGIVFFSSGSSGYWIRNLYNTVP